MKRLFDQFLKNGHQSSSTEGTLMQTPHFPPQMPVNGHPDLKKDLVFILLQFLNEENYTETVHKLEKESGVYFNMKYFEEILLQGDWDEAESYASGFIKINDGHGHSAMIFFHLRWHKYFESIIRGDRLKALDILGKELKTFEPKYPQLFKEMMQYITVPSYMENKQIYNESYVNSLRATAVSEIKKVIVSHPLLSEKIHFPVFSNKRLRTLLHRG